MRELNKTVGRRVNLSRPWLLPVVDRVGSRCRVNDNEIPQIRRAKQADVTVAHAKECAPTAHGSNYDKRNRHL